MDGIELIAFNIISAVGEARSKLMQAIEISRDGQADEAEQLVAEANQLLTKGDQEHFKVITQESKDKNVDFSLLLVHAEDQLMAAEIIRDLAAQMIPTNVRLYRLEKKLDK